MNATTINTTAPADRYAVDFSDGQSKYFSGLSMTYCANDAERDGWQAAAQQIATEIDAGVWAAVEDEVIGEDFSTHPWAY